MSIVGVPADPHLVGGAESTPGETSEERPLKPLVKVAREGAEGEKPYGLAHSTAITVQNLYSKNLSKGHKEMINNGLQGAMKMSPESIKQAFSFFTTGNIVETCDLVDDKLSDIVQTVSGSKTEGFTIIEDVSARSAKVLQSLWGQVNGLADKSKATVVDTVKAVNDARCSLVDETTRITGDTIVWSASMVGAGGLAEKHLIPVVKFGGEVVKTPTKAYRETVEALDADKDGEVSVSDVVATATAAAEKVVDVIHGFDIKELAVTTLEAQAAALKGYLGEPSEETDDVSVSDDEEEEPVCKSWAGQSVEQALKSVPQTVKLLNTLRAKARQFSSDNTVMRLDLFDVVESTIIAALAKVDEAGEGLEETWEATLLSTQEKVNDLRNTVNTLLTLPINGETKDHLIRATSTWVGQVGEDAWAPISDCTEYIASYKTRINFEGAKSLAMDTTSLTKHAIGYERNEDKYGRLDQQLRQLLHSIFNIKMLFVIDHDDDGKDG